MDKKFDKLIEKLIKDHPNDMDLGNQIRKLYSKKYKTSELKTIKINSNGF
jgi:hypothetical protein